MQSDKSDFFFTYILWSDHLQKFYVGSTNNLDHRLYLHNAGHENYTKKVVPWTFVWKKAFEERRHAFRLEMQIKKRGIRRFLDEQNKIY